MHHPRRSLTIVAAIASTIAFGGFVALSAGSADLATKLPGGHPQRSATTASPAYVASAREALQHYLRYENPRGDLAGRGHVPGSSHALEYFNWSGYADISKTKGTFSQVSGAWTTPAVSCTAEDQISSAWVGLDGATSNTVEQDGTISWCYKGKPVYFTWYEMYPAGTVEVGKSLKPGDKITASVVRTNTSYKLSLTDATDAADSLSVTKTCPANTCVDTSAEWVLERSQFRIGIAPLADYHSWTLSNASETASGKTGSISSYSGYDALTMIDATSAYDLSTVSGLAGGNAFTATWHNSY